MKGLTGKIKFDQHGLRTGFELDIIELKRDGLVKVGAWTESGGVNMTRNFTETYSEIVESLQNKTLIVTTIMVSRIILLIPTVNDVSNFSLRLTAWSHNHQNV